MAMLRTSKFMFLEQKQEEKNHNTENKNYLAGEMPHFSLKSYLRKNTKQLNASFVLRFKMCLYNTRTTGQFSITSNKSTGKMSDLVTQTVHILDQRLPVSPV